MRHLTKALGGTALALALAVPAIASAQDGDTGIADEIVVTAQKRSQTLIDVPQSVSVVSGATLERQGATGFADYLKNVPSLQLVQGTPGQGRLVLRGINTGGVASTVAVYVDETPFGSSTALANASELAGDFDSFDVARIEVLRGPQGTLYGASSLGGLLKFVTNEPSTAGFEAKLLGGVEFTDGGDASYRGAAMINVPLGETLAFRASGSYRKQGGTIDSIGTAGSNVRSNINDFENYGGRASLLWKPGANLSVRLSALFQNLYVDAPGVVEADPATLKPLYGGLTQSEYLPTFSNVKYRLYNGTIAYDFGPATLTSATSYGEQLQSFRADYTANLSPVLGTYVYFDQLTESRKLTQELRLASNGGDFLEWMIGGYYTHEKARIFQNLQTAVPGTPGVLTPIDLPYDLAVFNLASRYKEIAAFANATLHLAPWFDIDLGGRYSHNSQRADQVTDGVLLGAAVIDDVRSSDNVFTWSVAPKIKFGGQASLYARVAKGYRPGGPNVIPIGSPPGTPRTFEPDTVTSYEIGFKGDTADRTASIEAALYHIDWTNIQLAAVVNGFGVNVNGASARVDGAEIAATLRPAKGFTTSIGFTFTDARLGGDTDPLAVGAVKGDRLPFTPRYNVNFNADYQWELGSGVTASIGGSIRSLSRQSGGFDPAYLAAFGHFPRVKAYEVIDLRAGIDFGRYMLSAYANNLTNSGGVTSTQALLGVAGLPRNVNGALGTGVVRPRTIGVNATVEF
ncbi:outer membrane receptor protein involved in Fe transport [Sphingopyxis panaciterrae]|uniref:TonB-dependent receptor n=1 Tax=Sphingopyxis panaciterrae TaxID=363841 RepID=UPI0014204A0E|nr:TonB-dependent receptor [Sphingopyxis panaciterrae]NIJ37352.1 outer membrane receptor protein involved in Fe transport [Sphingopyxis panaciterrae]